MCGLKFKTLGVQMRLTNMRVTNASIVFFCTYIVSTLSGGYGHAYIWITKNNEWYSHAYIWLTKNNGWYNFNLCVGKITRHIVSGIIWGWRKPVRDHQQNRGCVLAYYMKTQTSCAVSTTAMDDHCAKLHRNTNKHDTNVYVSQIHMSENPGILERIPLYTVVSSEATYMQWQAKIRGITQHNKLNHS